MGLNVVQTTLAGYLDGLSSGQLPDAFAYVAPPAIDVALPEPRIFVWGGRLKEDRFTQGRGMGGQKRLIWQVDIWPILAMETFDPNADSAYPAFLDAIMQKLRTVQMGVTVTDAVTGTSSVLQEIGETLTLDYTTPQALADQRLVLYGGHIGCQVIEILDA